MRLGRGAPLGGVDTLSPSASSTLWIALAAAASLVALVQTARILWKRLSRTLAIRARSRRAVEGELQAEPLLRRAGLRGAGPSQGPRTLDDLR